VKDAEIGAIVKHLPPVEACRLLINLANQRGGSDNITVIVAQVGPLPEGMPPQPEEIPSDDSESDQSSWLWLGGLWASGLTFVLGVVYAMLQEAERERGVVLAVLSLIAFVVTLVFWRKHVRSQVGDMPAKLESTVMSRAYRTASAKLTPEVIEMLAKCESDMQKLAATEQWPLDARAGEVASAAAKAAFDNKQWTAALSEFAKSIDLLMAGWQLHRKAVAAREADEKEKVRIAAEKRSEGM
ncbi:MAG: hypothetical protein IAG10_26660, partial [Planctomycetaceae bacterium]|nr:hypothetical protein [Planctomycetaceae bacterium]